jgi:hypothetical protein
MTFDAYVRIHCVPSGDANTLWKEMYHKLDCTLPGVKHRDSVGIYPHIGIRQTLYVMKTSSTLQGKQSISSKSYGQ